MFIGWIGELKTRIQLGISLNGKIYHRFHDVFAPSGNGTTQIDHLVVSQFGVFIVETKNLKGWIYGDAYQGTWTQTIYRSKHKFQNPLRQTHRQKKVLAELLNLDEGKIFPVISFVGNCKFKTKMPPNVLRGGAGKYIKGFQDPIINGLELTRLTSIIEELQSNSKIHLSEHIESLNARHSSTVTCPKCGSPLVERETKRGKNVGSMYLEKWTTERALTKRRLILKRGFIRRKTEEISFNRVEEVNLSQSILQRIIGSGDIKVTGTGAGELMLKNIDDPLDVQKKVNELRNWE